MLDAIRKRKENFFYSFIILAVVIVMGFFGVGKMAGNRSEDGVAAWVNGEAVSQREFRQMMEYQIANIQARMGGQFDEKLLSAFQIPQRTLQELVQYKLLSQQAKSLGILVPDSELADYIRANYQRDGKFDAEAYSKLPNRGLEEKRQRERLQTVRFQNYLADRIKLTPAEIQKNHALNNTKVELEYAKIDFGALAPKSAPTKSQMEAYLKTVNENDLKTYYESHKDDFTDKAQVKFRQIRVGVPFKATEAVKAEAKKKIEAIAKEVNPGNFGEIAKAKSDDEYAKKGGDVGWMTRGSLEKPLEEALDKTALGTVSPVVQSSFGFFLLQPLEKKEATLKSFNDVKNQVGENLWKEKEKQKFVEEKRKAWEATVAKGTPLNNELKAAKIDVKKTGSFSLSQGYIPNIGQVDSMMDAVFELNKQSPVAKKLFFFQDHYYYLKLVSMDLPKKEDFAKNAPEVEKGLVTALQGEMLNTWIKDLQKKATIKMELAQGGKQNQQHETEED